MSEDFVEKFVRDLVILVLIIPALSLSIGFLIGFWMFS